MSRNKSKDELYKNKEWLKQHYNHFDMSMKEIGEDRDVSWSTIRHFLIKFRSINRNQVGIYHQPKEAFSRINGGRQNIFAKIREAICGDILQNRWLKNIYADINQVTLNLTWARFFKELQDPTLAV